jgi:hypothetical protein
MENKEKDGENVDKAGKWNKNAIAVDLTCHWKSSGEGEAIERSAIVIDFIC